MSEALVLTSNTVVVVTLDVSGKVDQAKAIEAFKVKYAPEFAPGRLVVLPSGAFISDVFDS